MNLFLHQISPLAHPRLGSVILVFQNFLHFAWWLLRLSETTWREQSIDQPILVASWDYSVSFHTSNTRLETLVDMERRGTGGPGSGHAWGSKSSPQ